jgi:hypothetical protein
MLDKDTNKIKNSVEMATSKVEPSEISHKLNEEVEE